MRKAQALFTLTSLYLDILITRSQYKTLIELIRTSEESDFFVDKVLELAEIVASIPDFYYYTGVGGLAVAYLHYFMGSYNCWIMELDRENGLAYGKSSFGGLPEYGEINIEELLDNGVELDLYWVPKPIGEIS